MSYYYYILIIIFSLFVFLVIRFFLRKEKHASHELLAKALKSENDGDFEEAVIIYQTVLDEYGKANSDKILQNKIIEKIKLLHTVIAYNKNTNLLK